MGRYKKCSNNVTCFNTLYLLSTCFLLSIIVYLLYNKNNSYNENIIHHSHPVSSFPFFNSSHNIQQNSGYDMLRPLANPGISYNEDPKDTLLNPYSPPIQYNQNHKYRQIGYLRRDKWYYYTIYDNIKLPIYTTDGRKCSSEHGCDSLMNGENVNVESLNNSFTVQTYDNNTLTYDPVI